MYHSIFISADTGCLVKFVYHYFSYNIKAKFYSNSYCYLSSYLILNTLTSVPIAITATVITNSITRTTYPVTPAVTMSIGSGLISGILYMSLHRLTIMSASFCVRLVSCKMSLNNGLCRIETGGQGAMRRNSSNDIQQNWYRLIAET